MQVLLNQLVKDPHNIYNYVHKRNYNNKRKEDSG